MDTASVVLMVICFVVVSAGIGIMINNAKDEIIKAIKEKDKK